MTNTDIINGWQLIIIHLVCRKFYPIFFVFSLYQNIWLTGRMQDRIEYFWHEPGSAMSYH